MFVALLSACIAPSPLVGETLTDDGTWRLSLTKTEYDQGDAPIEVLAEEVATGAPATELTVFVRPDMSEMGHSLKLYTFEAGNHGDYHAEIRFDMAGLWTLTGYAGDDLGQEGFSFVVMVDP